MLIRPAESVLNFWRNWVDNTILSNFYFHLQKEKKKQDFCHPNKQSYQLHITVRVRLYCLVVMDAFEIPLLFQW